MDKKDLEDFIAQFVKCNQFSLEDWRKCRGCVFDVEEIINLCKFYFQNGQ